MANGYRMCSRCIMGTTDPDIWFGEKAIISRLMRRYESIIR